MVWYVWCMSTVWRKCVWYVCILWCGCAVCVVYAWCGVCTWRVCTVCCVCAACVACTLCGVCTVWRVCSVCGVGMLWCVCSMCDVYIRWCVHSMVDVCVQCVWCRPGVVLHMMCVRDASVQCVNLYRRTLGRAPTAGLAESACVMGLAWKEGRRGRRSFHCTHSVSFESLLQIPVLMFWSLSHVSLFLLDLSRGNGAISIRIPAQETFFLGTSFEDSVLFCKPPPTRCQRHSQ